MSAPPPPNEIGRFFGLILIAVGALVMALSGLCTAAFAVMLLAESPGANLGEALSFLLLALVYGGIAALAGLGLFAIGRWLRPKQ